MVYVYADADVLGTERFVISVKKHVFPHFFLPVQGDLFADVNETAQTYISLSSVLLNR